MSFNTRSWLIASAIVCGLGAGGAALAQDAEPAEAAASCPVNHAALVQRLRAAVAEVGSNPMWASVVNRDGIVCAVAFSGPNRNAQFPVSRVISAAKAFTANGVSLDGAPLSTAQLYPATQPRGSLFGLDAGNPVDAAAATAG